MRHLVALKREVIPVVILVLLAGAFALLVRSQQLTTAAGPGLSMFSDADYSASRQLQTEITHRGTTAPAVLPEEIERELVAQRSAPDASQLIEVTEALADLRWVLADDGRYRVGDGVKADEVRLALVAIRTDGERLISVPLIEVGGSD